MRRFFIVIGIVVLAACSFLFWKGIPAAEDVDSPAYASPARRADLPDVLIIGDSISIGYTLPVRKALNGAANVERIPENAKSSAYAKEHLAKWLGDRRFAVIVFNVGLHDFKHISRLYRLFGYDKLVRDGQKWVTLYDYAQNLSVLIAQLRRHTDCLLFATTTPVPEGAFARDQREGELYNAVAQVIMRRESISTIDLNAVVTANPNWQLPQNVHFSDEGYEYLGAEVAKVVRSKLAGK
jgi:hypothetical protein